MKPRDVAFLALSAAVGMAVGFLLGKGGRAAAVEPDPARQGFTCGEEKVKHRLPRGWTVSSEDQRVWDRNRILVCDSGGKPASEGERR